MFIMGMLVGVNRLKMGPTCRSVDLPNDRWDRCCLLQGIPCRWVQTMWLDGPIEGSVDLTLVEPKVDLLQVTS